MNELHFTDTGSEHAAIVFLHYFGGSGHTWQPVIEKLQGKYRCIAMDMLGFGHSPAAQEEPSVHQNRDAVLAVLENLQLQNFALVGHSMGGKIALAVAAIQPEGLTNIILFAPSPPTAEPMTPDARQELTAAFGNKEKTEAHIQKITAEPLPPEWFEQTVADNLRTDKNAWMGWINKGSKEDISGEMDRIQVPVTVISGAKDEGLTTAFLQTEFKKYFPLASFHEIQGSGHLLPLEKPAEVIATIEAVLQQ